MPIRVRCEGCQKALSLPDAAAGKAVRCPHCQTKFRAPARNRRAASGKAGAQKKKRAAEQDPEDLLSSLDLSQIEDKSARICPKCATEVSEDVIECPNCGVNIKTGLLSEKTRRRMSAKGPDPSLYYKGVWKNAWQFTMAHKKFVFRTVLYTTVFSLIYYGCLYMAFGFCRTMPPRVFWAGLGFVASLVPPGWHWFLTTEIIKSTLDQQKKLPRINFDLFTCVALGIKLIVWELAFFAQLGVGLVGVALAHFVSPVLGAILIAVGMFLPLLFFPLVMVHMSMPVTYPAWLIHKMFPVLLKNFAPALYWCLVLFVTCLPIILVSVLVGVFCGRDIATFAGTMVYNSSVASAPSGDEEGTVAAPPEGGEEAAEKKPLDWKPLIVPGVAVVVIWIMGGFIAVFNMRSNGVLAYCFKSRLNLIGRVKEKKYVSQEELRKQKEAQKLEKQKQKEEKRRLKEEKKKQKKRR